MPRVFFHFKKKNFFLIFYEYFSFSLTWDPMGVQISKCYSSLKSLLNPIKPFLNFLLSGPYKMYCFGFLKFLIRDFSGFFFHFASYGTLWEPKTSKHYSSLKSLLNHFNLFLNVLLSGSHKSTDKSTHKSSLSFRFLTNF